MTKKTTILIFFLFPICILSIDQMYEACKPFECGSLNITYPFYIPLKQPSFCGSEGFEVSCNNKNHTVLKLSGDDYIINSISYQEQSINITNTAFSNSAFGCLSSIHNLTLNNDGKFNFTSKPKHILLLQNCSRNYSMSSIIKNYTRITCEEDSGLNGAILAMREEDSNQVEFGLCEKAVLVPYMGGNFESGIEGILRKGIVLEYTGNNCNVCRDSGGRCGFDKTNSKPFCLCPDRPHRILCRPEIPTNKVSVAGRLRLGLGIGFSIVGTIGLITLYFSLTRKKKSAEFSIFRKRGMRANLNAEAFLISYGSMAPKRYTYSDLKKMTSSFKEKVGQGGYGAVYKGKSPDGRLVAVKLLKQSKGDDGEDFINEVASISKTNHVNVVTLLGFCIEGNKRALVFEFMVNGSLDRFTKDEAKNGQSLTWQTTFQVSLGIARGLEYLHRGCKTRILHFDIKPQNILLDESFCPKISDFGLAKLYPRDKESRISMSMARGTIGYIAPEVFCRNFGEISHKSDVYSYGMMVLEVIGSRRNRDDDVETLSSELYFPDWIYEQLDHGDKDDVDICMDDEEMELKRKMILVSLWCIQTVPSSRPSMSRVVQMLEASVETIEIPPMPSLSSPPRPQQDLSWSSTVTQ